MKGYKFHPLSSDAFSAEKLNTMRAFGAELEVIAERRRQGDAGAVRSLQGAHRRADEGAEHASGPISSTTPTRSKATPASAANCSSRSARVDAFVGAVGSAGMLMGVAGALKARGCKTRIIALEPATSPLLTTGKGGPHRVEGTAPRLLAAAFEERRLRRSAGDRRGRGREIARRAAREDGIFAGTSSGLEHRSRAGCGARGGGLERPCATVAVDTGLKYPCRRSLRVTSFDQRLIDQRLEGRRHRRARIPLHHHDGDEPLLRIDPEVRAVDAAPAVHARPSRASASAPRSVTTRKPRPKFTPGPSSGSGGVRSDGVARRHQLDRLRTRAGARRRARRRSAACCRSARSRSPSMRGRRRRRNTSCPSL